MEKTTLIIPTTASIDRQKSLIEAIDSAESSSKEKIKIITVINGERYSEETIKLLKNNNRIKIIQLEKPSAPFACFIGVKNVTTPYYCFLDDDDLYINNAIDLRTEYLEKHPDTDLVVTNGFRYAEGVICINNLNSVIDDPLLGSLKSNWLASCGAMFRKSTVSHKNFENYIDFVEWTWLAYNLALNKYKIGAIDIPTYFIKNTPRSLSKSPEYDSCLENLYNKMLQTKHPFRIKKEILSKLGELKHAQSESDWNNGKFLSAWIKHIASLTYPGGLKYLLYTRHLLFPKNKNE